MRALLCKMGIHLPRREEVLFVDAVDGRNVWRGKCACGIDWLHNETGKFRRF